jgi:hypothetical protein
MKAVSRNYVYIIATCFGFCGKSFSGNVNNTKRKIIYITPIRMALFIQLLSQPYRTQML